MELCWNYVGGFGGALFEQMYGTSAFHVMLGTRLLISVVSSAMRMSHVVQFIMLFIICIFLCGFSSDLLTLGRLTTHTSSFHAVCHAFHVILGIRLPISAVSGAM